VTQPPRDDLARKRALRAEHRARLYDVGAETESPDDMQDAPVWLRSPTLGPVLTLCAHVLVHPFLDAEADALNSQASHRRITLCAAMAGLLAIGIALFEFVHHGRSAGDRPWAVAEFIAIAAALTAIGLGGVAARRDGWIAKRHRAERIRELKFRLLIEPARWTGAPGQLEAAEVWIRDELRKIDRLTRRDIALWARREEARQAPVPPSGREQLRPILRDLVRYYIDRRLSIRRESPTSRRRHRRLVQWVPLWAIPYLFLFAVVAVVCHLLLVTVADGTPQALTEWLLIAAVLLPVLGATLRTLRLSGEADRPRLRSRAGAVILRSLKAALRKEQSPDGILSTLWSCEQVLEWEHREWVRRLIGVRS
jgi:hypothetical protein